MIVLPPRAQSSCPEPRTVALGKRKQVPEPKKYIEVREIYYSKRAGNVMAVLVDEDHYVEEVVLKEVDPKSIPPHCFSDFAQRVYHRPRSIEPLPRTTRPVASDKSEHEDKPQSHSAQHQDEVPKD